MRKYITLILILIGLEAFAQPYVKQFSRFEYVNGQRFDSTFRIFNLPTFTGDTVIAFNPYTKKIGLKILSSSGGTWGSITGTLSNQTDLQNALNLKLNISDTAAMLSPYALSSEVPTYLAGRGITKSGVTFRLDTTQYYTWTNARTRWNAAPIATSTYGLANFGNGAFDGVTAGYFTGSSSGTVNAINITGSSIFADWQKSGVVKFQVDNTGGLYAAGFLQSQVIKHSTSASAISVQAALSIVPTSALTAISSTGISLTGSQSIGIVNLAQTWNTTGNPTAIKLNVTNTASGATSKLLDLQVGGSSLVSVDKSGNFVATNVLSGTYTPTLTNTTNVAASTAYVNQYMRVGSVVTVSGKVVIDPTAAGALELEMTIPIASNFTAEEQCGGTAISDAALDDGVAIGGHVTNNTASFHCTAVGTGSQIYHFTFTYSIL